jgi:hypothetical protein
VASVFLFDGRIDRSNSRKAISRKSVIITILSDVDSAWAESVMAKEIR